MIRWLIWSCYVIAWTIALEVKTPPPLSGVGAAFLEPHRLLIAKSMHVVVYIGMTLLAAWVVLSARHRSLMVFFLMAHACATELLQDILEPYSHRRGSLMDVAFDHLGILIGILLTWKRWTGGDQIGRAHV